DAATADNPNHVKGIGEAVELTDVVAHRAANPDLARACNLFVNRDLTPVRSGQPAQDHAIAVQRQQLGHAGLIDSVEIELRLARQHIDVEVRVGVPFNE